MVTGQTLNQSTTLMTDMLSGYDRRQRPILNQSAAIEVGYVTSNNLALLTKRHKCKYEHIV